MQQHNAGKQRQPGRGRDQQRLPRTDARAFRLCRKPISRNDVDPGQFPEDEQQNEMIGEHGAEHRGHEQHQVTVELAVA